MLIHQSVSGRLTLSRGESDHRQLEEIVMRNATRRVKKMPFFRPRSEGDQGFSRCGAGSSGDDDATAPSPSGQMATTTGVRTNRFHRQVRPSSRVGNPSANGVSWCALQTASKPTTVGACCQKVSTTMTLSHVSLWGQSPPCPLVVQQIVYKVQAAHGSGSDRKRRDVLDQDFNLVAVTCRVVRVQSYCCLVIVVQWRQKMQNQEPQLSHVPVQPPKMPASSSN